MKRKELKQLMDTYTKVCIDHNDKTSAITDALTIRNCTNIIVNIADECEATDRELDRILDVVYSEMLGD